jgi:hypothetical protein
VPAGSPKPRRRSGAVAAATRAGRKEGGRGRALAEKRGACPPPRAPTERRGAQAAAPADGLHTRGSAAPSSRNKVRAEGEASGRPPDRGEVAASQGTAGRVTSSRSRPSGGARSRRAKHREAAACFF